MVNVGAGTGSYEPRDRLVIAVDPSVLMVRQRGPADGQWDYKYGYLRAQPELDLGYRLIVADA